MNSFTIETLLNVAAHDKLNLLVVTKQYIWVSKNEPSDQFFTILHSSLFDEDEMHYYVGKIKQTHNFDTYVTTQKSLTIQMAHTNI